VGWRRLPNDLLVTDLDEVYRLCNHFEMTALRALMALSLALSSCASTSGHDWLNSPIEQRAEPPVVRAEQIETVAESRPRLSHTVTLGESYATEATPDAAYALAGGAAVQVNVHTQVPVIINNMGGYGFGYGYPYAYGAGSFAAPVRTTRTAPPKVGADFPVPPDYGPPALK
jgi:hypothetical protein